MTTELFGDYGEPEIIRLDKIIFLGIADALPPLIKAASIQRATIVINAQTTGQLQAGELGEFVLIGRIFRWKIRQHPIPRRLARGPKRPSAVRPILVLQLLDV